MNTYDDEALQQINETVDLLEYVINTGQIEMKRRGHDYFGCCPLHTDKTPSFSITPEKNSYYCFSCGKSGGIIGFLMDYEGLRFDDAVKKAARLANMDLDKMCKSPTATYLKKIRAIKLKQNGTFEHPILNKAVLDKYATIPVEEWLDEGINQDVMDLFGIRIDVRQNRIIYPVHDIEGNLINIKGRTRYKNYKDMHIPKYINYYSVGVMDYFQGLNITLPYVKAANEIIIFESLKSVMKVFGWDNKNAASAEKHTLTNEQINLLVRLNVNVVFAYDSDISYWSKDVKQNIDRLKKVTNVFIVEDKRHLLGGKEAKNAPADCGREIWEELYRTKRKVV